MAAPQAAAVGTALPAAERRNAVAPATAARAVTAPSSVVLVTVAVPGRASLAVVASVAVLVAVGKEAAVARKAMVAAGQVGACREEPWTEVTAGRPEAAVG